MTRRTRTRRASFGDILLARKSASASSSRALRRVRAGAGRRLGLCANRPGLLWYDRRRRHSLCPMIRMAPT